MKNTNLILGSVLSGKTRGVMFDTLETLIQNDKNLFIIDNKEEIIGFIEKTILGLHDMTEIEKEILTAKAETKTKLEAVNEYVKLNSRTAIPQEEYSEIFDKLVTEYDAAQEDVHRLEKEKNDIYVRNEQCKKFVQTLKQSDILQDFDEELFNSTVEKISVYTDRLVFEFSNGMEREYVSI